jgi:branched-chain amino acid transport system substrate-binding protein
LLAARHRSTVISQDNDGSDAGEAKMFRRRLLGGGLATIGGLAASRAMAVDKNYGPGVTDTEIKLGQFAAYSGPLSAFSVQNKAGIAFFDMVNAEGGVNGRKVKIISLDDGYVPPKSVEVTRQLVEQEKVLALYMPLGTPTNSAIHKYMNQKQVPQLFITSGAVKWGDPKGYPWTMGWLPSFQAEGGNFTRYVLKTKPDARIGILYQNDDFGKDYLRGIQAALGKQHARMIVSEQAYETTDPTIDTQIINLKASGADVLMNIASIKFAAMAIRKMADLGWKPLHFLNSPASGVSATLAPAGFDNSTGIITADFLKDPSDPRWKDDKAMADYLAWLTKYQPDANPADRLNVVGYSIGQTMLQVLKQCGNDLTRQNVMKQAANLDIELPMLLPGIKIKTSPEDFFPIEGEYLQRFDGARWVVFGDLLQ